MRFGLCCLFADQPVAFRVTTARALRPYDRNEQLLRLSEICRHNAASLLSALRVVHSLGIGAFRIMSGLFPRMTHPEIGYSLNDLPERDEIARLLEEVSGFRREHDIRLSFHPDQFNILSSPRPEVVASTIRELEYQAEVAVAVGADVITIHGGGAYGDKEEALRRFRLNFPRLSVPARGRLAVENDDRVFTVRDLLPLCDDLGLPLVYDVHHHRCNPDGLTVEQATEAASATWRQLNREPYFHISSPRDGWGATSPRDHADYIDVADYPVSWLGRDGTVDVEAKAKELAVVRLMADVAALFTASS